MKVAFAGSFAAQLAEPARAELTADNIERTARADRPLNAINAVT